MHHNAEKSRWRPGWSFFELAASATELLSKLSVGIHIKAFRVKDEFDSKLAVAAAAAAAVAAVVVVVVVVVVGRSREKQIGSFC